MAPAFNNPWTALLLIAVMMMYGAVATLLVMRYYQHTGDGDYLVRSGVGGMKVVLRGGCFVIPKWHRVVRICAHSFELNIDDTDHDGVLTRDDVLHSVEIRCLVQVRPEARCVRRCLLRALGGVEENARLTARDLAEMMTPAAVRTIRQVLSQIQSGEVPRATNRIEKHLDAALRSELAEYGCDAELLFCRVHEVDRVFVGG